MKKPGHFSRTVFISAFLLAIAAAIPSARLLASDGAPALAQDEGARIGDVYAFQNPGDITKTVLIATVHDFIVPGKAPAVAEFDPGVHYHFEIYNDHVNSSSPALNPTASATVKKAYLARVKPSLTIDVTFSKPQVGSAPQVTGSGVSIPANLRMPLPQQATIKLAGFAGVRNKGVFTVDGSNQVLTVTPFSDKATASAFNVQTVKDVKPGDDVDFFAGEVDDPFFFDVPAFSSYLDSVRVGSPNSGVFARSRDSYAGYNVLAIAIRIPTSLLTGPAGSLIGVDFMTQRLANRLVGSTGSTYSGALKTVDRMGNPLVGRTLVPFDAKNLYAAASPKDDVSLKFAGTITQTLKDLGLVVSPPEAAFTTLINLIVAKGDLLQLDTSVSNSGSNPAAGFPNGRRPADDAVDYFLTEFNHGTTLPDGVTASDLSPSGAFPFLSLPHQPLFNTSVDDSTRN